MQPRDTSPSRSKMPFWPLFISILLAVLGISGLIIGGIFMYESSTASPRFAKSILLSIVSIIATIIAIILFLIAKSQSVIPEKPQTLPVQQKKETPSATVQSSGQQKKRKLFPGGASQIFAFLSYVCFCIALPSYVAAKTFDNPTFVDIAAWALLGGLGFASACAGNDLGKKF